MNNVQSLLIELGTEELPVKALPGLAEAFLDAVKAGLERRQIGFDSQAARALYGPRRLAVLVPGVEAQQPTQNSERRGPAVSAGYGADGEPSKALLGFAASCGVDVRQLRTVETDKGAWFVFRQTLPGAATAALVPEILHEAVKALPVPKPMRWSDHDFAFVRPLHWLVVLLGDKVIDAELFGIVSNRMSRGHRFHHPKSVWVGSADDYIEVLRQTRVLADPDERRAAIRSEVEQAARQAGGQARIDAGVLEEVNCLTEWPKAVLCSFEPTFLEVPAEALIATMEANQKFFPVLDGEGRLSAHFVGVANIDSSDPQQVRKGYERVIRPRFADARFFYVEDRKQGLSAMADGLAHVTYQQKLGSIADKVARVSRLAEALASETGIDAARAARAAGLAKADLQSRLVGEFPELQGIAGRYYAIAEGETTEIAIAIDESYQPRFAGDQIAATPLGQLLAVAERLDTLAGGFAAGLKPTGNKDPFALRRAALGLARTLIEGDLDIDLHSALEQACQLADGLAAEPTELYDFILERLRGYFAERGVAGDHFEAVATSRPASLSDFGGRLNAVSEFIALPEAAALAAANKRIGNILKKTDVEIPDKVSRTRLLEPAEIALAESVESAIRETESALTERDYVAVLKRLAWLRAPVDDFFDQVMVMAEDPALRENRLAILKRLSDRFHAVADIGRLSLAG
ncbi:MAG: glycine--tRNA ligase subunit beta [Xanthomonadaceae bacterium]|nr:glycine--tRNA ligase subunit beta [Xanthomonadaceae bacterium]